MFSHMGHAPELRVPHSCLNSLFNFQDEKRIASTHPPSISSNLRTVSSQCCAFTERSPKHGSPRAAFTETRFSRAVCRFAPQSKNSATGANLPPVRASHQHSSPLLPPHHAGV